MIDTPISETVIVGGGGGAALAGARPVVDMHYADFLSVAMDEALQNGVDIKTVSGMLGHFSAGFTLDTYAHVTTDAQLKAAQTMGNILSRAV